MTLREEVLKNSGLLTEMPIVHESEDSLHIYFLTFSFLVNNRKKVIRTNNDGSILSKPSEILDFILTTNNIEMEEYEVNGSEPKSEKEVDVSVSIFDPDLEYDTAEDVVFNGTDAVKIIKYITNKFKNQMVKDINDNLKLYTFAAKKSKEDPYMRKEYLSAIDSLKFAKDYIDKI